ncbi:MAG: ligase-associated DNA damage response exonuclease [Ignavibacteriaceae bacterium]
MNKKLLTLNNCGLFCEAGDFYIDPWRAVDKAVITHAHSDHAKWGSKKYLAVKESELLLRLRLGSDINLQVINYNESLNINDVKVSLHPAGHILGSAQVRLEYKGEVCVISGDYKIEADDTCAPFELVKCHTFITESTFGLPVYKWCRQQEIFDDINNWWRRNRNNEITSIIYGYALGKAQRVLSGLDTSIGKIYTHGAVENINQCYRNTGVNLPETNYIGEVEDKELFKGAIIIAPPSADSAAWTKRFYEISDAFASGWMQIRGNRRRRNVDKGFILSDHADWDGLVSTIKETGAEQVCVTHGYSSPLVNWLKENGWNAGVLNTMFEGEVNDSLSPNSQQAGIGSGEETEN